MVASYGMPGGIFRPSTEVVLASELTVTVVPTSDPVDAVATIASHVSGMIEMLWGQPTDSRKTQLTTTVAPTGSGKNLGYSPSARTT